MDKRGILLLILFLISFISADIISVNSGGSNEIVITSGGFLEDFFSGDFSCTIINSCSSLGYSCGDISNGCGGTLSCGSCSSGYTCSSGTCVAVTTTPSAGGGGGGGGGGGSLPKLSQIKIVPESFNIPATVGVTGFGKLSVSNPGEVPLEIIVELVNLEGVVEFEKTSFSLGVGKEEILSFRILPPKEPGIFSGKIVLLAGFKKLEIPVAINVKSEMSLFDISVDISRGGDVIETNQTLMSQITLLQAGLQEKADVVVAYVIKDFEGNTYSETSETIMVYKEKTYPHEFKTSNLPPGDYLVGAEVIYSGGVATASHQFKILNPELKKSYFFISLEFLAILIILGMLVVLLKKYKSNFFLHKKR